jgi:hypothetical protein
MKQDEIIEMAEKAGFDCYGKHITWDDVICTNELNAFAKLVAAKEREAIQDEYWMCVNSDLENGVKSLNEKVAERFTTYFPELSKFGRWLEARGEQA